MRKPLPRRFGKTGMAARRRTVSVSQEALVRHRLLAPQQKLPLVVEPANQDVDLASWSRSQRDALNQQLYEHGAILLRGFAVDSVDRFEEVIAAMSGELLEYRERSSPRSQVSGNIYTSTDYPPDQPIFLHNENSYQHQFPRKIFFYCVTPAAEGGQTPLADCRRVLERLDPEIRRRFLERQWMYVRNFNEGFGLPWQTVFQTSDRAAVEAHCREHGIDFEWKGEETLRTRAVRPAISRHPVTGELVWFNHATILHVSTLTPAVREALLADFAEEELPTNSYYGDGSPIESEVLDQLRAAYHAETIAFPWQEGDILMVDNTLVAHGRQPFSGERLVVVGMSEPMAWEQMPPVELES